MFLVPLGKHRPQRVPYNLQASPRHNASRSLTSTPPPGVSVPAAVQEGSFRQAPATMQALARFRPEAKADPVDVARGMDILVPGAVANAIRMDQDKSHGGSAVLQVRLFGWGWWMRGCRVVNTLLVLGRLP